MAKILTLDSIEVTGVNVFPNPLRVEVNYLVKAGNEVVLTRSAEITDGLTLAVRAKIVDLLAAIAVAAKVREGV